jgi:transposase InsO family protein
LALEDYSELTGVMWEHVEEMVKQARRWSGWPKDRSLAVLGVSRAAYYRRRRAVSPSAPWPWRPGAGARPPQPHAVLAWERETVKAYALKHPNPRHRELAWKMVDEGVVCLSPSAVYRILREEGLVSTWPQKREKRRREWYEKARRPDERWQSDIRYVQVGSKKYYLVIFLDEFSRQVTHHELMCWLDGDTLSLEAQRAIEKLPAGVKPVVQTDNGSGYISQEFKKVLTENGLGHIRITPHCPEENGLVERTHRTLGEVLNEMELTDLEQARARIAEVVRWYNEERLHSALKYLRPMDYYRGDPEKLLEERRRKLAEARHQRKEANLDIRQRTLAFEVSEDREVATYFTA